MIEVSTMSPLMVLLLCVGLGLIFSAIIVFKEDLKRCVLQIIAYILVLIVFIVEAGPIKHWETTLVIVFLWFVFHLILTVIQLVRALRERK